MNRRFNLQGHRGARGLRPENTLPAFEFAFDLGVTSIETDLHLTLDLVPVLLHDPAINERICRLLPEGAEPPPRQQPLICQLTLAELRSYTADLNPDPQRFPAQQPLITPLTRWFAEQRGIHPYTPPTLVDLIDFWRAYLGPPGIAAGKKPEQQHQAQRLIFDLELKRVPFQPETIGDGFTGTTAGAFEQRVLDVVRQAGLLEQVVVRSFDHRCVLALRRLEPALRTAVLVANTAPVQPAELAAAAGAQIYCPDVNFLDESQVRLLHQAGLQVLPWTVNEETSWERLLAWGVDGITTDYPDRLADWLHQRGVAW